MTGSVLKETGLKTLRWLTISVDDFAVSDANDEISVGLWTHKTP